VPDQTGGSPPVGIIGGLEVVVVDATDDDVVVGAAGAAVVVVEGAVVAGSVVVGAVVVVVTVAPSSSAIAGVPEKERLGEERTSAALPAIGTVTTRTSGTTTAITPATRQSVGRNHRQPAWALRISALWRLG
jgi:hypothetical protein